MTRGDQRERDRAKKQARLQKEAKPKEGNPASRNLNDSAALAAKVAQKAELKQKQEEEALKAMSNKPVVRKKTTSKADAALDDLLLAGLSGKKK